MIRSIEYKGLLTKEKCKELIRFFIVGVTMTFLQYYIYWLLKFWINYNIAYTISYFLSFIVNFFLTTYFTFRSRATIKKGLGFSGVHIFNYFFQMVLLNAFVFIGIDKTFAPIPVYILVVPIQFILVRFVVKKS